MIQNNLSHSALFLKFYKKAWYNNIRFIAKRHLEKFWELNIKQRSFYKEASALAVIFCSSHFFFIPIFIFLLLLLITKQAFTSVNVDHNVYNFINKNTFV